MDLELLRLAGRLGGTLLQAAGAVPLLLVERIARHGAPQALLLGVDATALAAPLEAIGALQEQGLDFNLLAALDPGEDREAILLTHRRRLGSLVCALEVRPPQAEPFLPKRLPGWIQADRPLAQEPARLSPLERAQLAERFPESDLQSFTLPTWERTETGWTARSWPGTVLPAGARLVRPGLELPTASPVSEALRAALRAASRQPVPFLPGLDDPARLQALALLGSEVQQFPGTAEAWRQAFRALAALPAPPHFCARC